MKKIIGFLIILAAICLAENYNSSTEGTYGTGTAYFSPAVDSSWWLFGYPNAGNYYDTVSGYAVGNYQVIDSVNLDSVGVHLVKIYGFSAGAYSDSVQGVWEHRAKISELVWHADTAGHNGIVGTYGEIMAKPAYVQGASSFTSAEIAHEVIDSLGFGIGAGDYSCSLYVLNSDDTTAIQSVWVTVYSSDGGTLYGKQDTDVNGLRVFKLDAEDSVIYYPVKNGVAFTVPEYISITEAQTDTIWGDVLNPAPATGDMVALQFYQLTPGYDTLAATKVEYKLIKDSTGTEFELTDRVTFGTGTSTIALSKSWNTANAQIGDTSYVTFSVFSNYDIRVNGVQDSTSYYNFIVRWKNGQETEAIKQIDKTSPQNPMAP